MKTIFRFTIVLLTMFLTCGSICAQKNNSNSKSREEFIETQAKFLAQELALDSKTSAQFVDTYSKQQREIWALQSKTGTQRGTEEAQSGQAIQEQFQRSQQILSIREKYYKEYSTFMSQKQIQRMYDLERQTAKQLTAYSKEASVEYKDGVPFNGIVTDLLNQPVKGARIWIKKNRVAKSDKEGKFGLTNVGANDTIHIKYQKVTYLIPVEGRKSVRVHLGDQIKADEDDELANMGYNFVKRREKLIPSNGISGEDLILTGQTDILQALVGLVPGYNMVNGKPEIRGKGSITLSTEPLYILDGVVVTSFSGVNIYDVDHVEVLKDASIYGSRGANGAIIVTTKRGF